MFLTVGMTLHMGNLFGTNFLVYLIVAAIVGIIAEVIYIWRMFAGWRQFLRDTTIRQNVAWLGILLGGSIIAGIVGAWFMTQIIVLPGFGHIGDINVAGVPIIRAVLGAIILVTIWCLQFLHLYLSFSLWVRYLFYDNDPRLPYP